MEAFRTMPKMGREEFEDHLYFLWVLASQISRLGYESLRRSQTVVELKRYRENLQSMVRERTEQLEKALKKIEALSVKDSLTGCFNRRYLSEKLPSELKRANRYERRLALILVDIDHFKDINDTHGHLCGDQVLIEFVDILQKNLRKGVDWLVRYGGEEFVLVLPETGLPGAEKHAERLRTTIQDARFRWEGESVSITASFGVSAYDPTEGKEGFDAENLIESADACLYEAKQGGRNRVVSGPAE